MPSGEITTAFRRAEELNARGKRQEYSATNPDVADVPLTAVNHRETATYDWAIQDLNL